MNTVTKTMARLERLCPGSALASSMHKPVRKKTQERKDDKDQSHRRYGGSRVVGPTGHEGSFDSRADLSRAAPGTQALDVERQPMTSRSVSGTSSESGSNHAGLKTMRFLCFIARLAVRAMIASPIATVPGHRRPPS